MTKIDALELELKCRKMVEDTDVHWSKVLREVATKEPYSHTGRYFDSYDKSELEVALGIVEGKPVWEGDELYCANGIPYIAKQGESKEFFSHLSWNPPKPKTVMVELRVEDAEYWAKYNHDDCPQEHQRLAKNCSKELEKLK